MPKGQSDAELKGAGGKKPKFDPDTLTPELRAIYDGMSAEYTKKTQAHGKEQAAMKEQLAKVTAAATQAASTVQYYERMLAQVYQEGGDAGAGAGAGYESAGQGTRSPGGNGEMETPQWEPFDRSSQEGLIRHHLGNYHKQLTEVYNGLVKGIMELQAYNLQLQRVTTAPLYAKMGMEMPDIQKIVSAAPQYGHNLEQAYRAVYESPKVWEQAGKFDANTKTIADLQTKVKALEAAGRSPNAGVLGGTAGPVPRTVAKGQAPKTYAEIAASISPGEVYAPDGGEAGAGTAGAGGGGSAE